MPRITNAKVTHISLVPRGANRLPVMYKSEDKSAEFDTLVKAASDFDEKGEILAVVYAPEIRDSQNEIADAGVIRKMAHGFMRDGEGIDFRHDGKVLAKEKVHLAESFIVQKDDARFKDFKDHTGKVVDVSGAWATVIKVECPELRKLYRSGEWNGVSMGGFAERATEKEGGGGKGGFKKAFKKLIKSWLKGQIEETETLIEEDAAMPLTKEEKAELATLVKETVADAMKTDPVVKAAADKAAADAAAKTAAPVFKGDPSKPADVAKHLRLVKEFQARQEIDWTDPVAVEAYHTALVKGLSDGSGEADPFAGMSDREAELEKELRDLRKASNANGGEGSGGEGSGKQTTFFSGMEKSDQVAAAAGARMAQFANKNRGLVKA